MLRLLLPGMARADDVVNVTISNLTFTGNPVCELVLPPPLPIIFNLVCTETFNGSFLWDNSTNALVGSPQLTGEGPLGGAFPLIGSDTFAFVVSGMGFVIIESEWQTCAFTELGVCVGDELFLDLGESSGGELLPGNFQFSNGTALDPGRFEASVLCVTSTCLVDFQNPPAKGPTFSTGQVSVASVPVPSVPEASTGILLGTGLLGLVGAIRFKLLA
jgi:hypothetical protein